MIDHVRSFFGPVTVPSGGALPFAVFLWSAGQLIAALTCTYAVALHVASAEFSSFAMLATTIVPFAWLFAQRDEHGCKKIKDALDLVWRCWTLFGFFLIFHGLAAGSQLSLEGVLGVLPVSMQSVLFGLFGGTVCAQVGLSMSGLARKNQTKDSGLS